MIILYAFINIIIKFKQIFNLLHTAFANLTLFRSRTLKLNAVLHRLEVEV